MKYVIVKSCDEIGLVDFVQEYLERGWRPTGGVAIGRDGILYQAVVRDQEKAEPKREIVDAVVQALARGGFQQVKS